MSGFYLTDKPLPESDPLIAMIAENNAWLALHFVASAVLVGSILVIGLTLAPAELIAWVWHG